MKALLDTHTLLWWLDGDEQLSFTARSWIETTEHRILVSAAFAWEIATKVRIGKLPGAQVVALWRRVKLFLERNHLRRTYQRWERFNALHPPVFTQGDIKEPGLCRQTRRTHNRG